MRFHFKNTIFNTYAIIGDGYDISMIHGLDRDYWYLYEVVI